MKVITQNYVNCVPFSCIDSFHNFNNRIFKKYELTSINFTNEFDILG